MTPNPVSDRYKKFRDDIEPELEKRRGREWNDLSLAEKTRRKRTRLRHREDFLEEKLMQR